MAKGVLAFLAGLGSGYLTEGRRQEDKERQDKIDQIRFDQADREKSEWARQEKTRDDIAAASKDGGPVVDDAQVVDGISTKPVTYEDKDVAATDVRQVNRMLRQAPVPISATQGIATSTTTPPATDAQAAVPMAAIQGIAQRDPAAIPTAPAMASQQGATMAPLGKPMFQGKEYANAGDAKAAADTYNSPEARNARVAQAMRANGDHEGALRVESTARQAALADFQMKVANHNWGRQVIAEGTEDAFKALGVGDSKGMEDAFNKSGKYKIAGGVQITPSQIALPDGSVRANNIASFNIVREDGTVVPMKISAQEMEKTLIKADEFAKINLEEQYKALNRAWTSKEDDKKLASAEKLQKMSVAVQYARMAQDERHYQDSTPAGKIRQIEAAITDYKMPNDKRKEMLGIDNLDQKTRLLVNSNLKESDQLQASMSKAMADGTWQPDSPGGKALVTRQAVLTESLRNMLSVGVGKQNSDPLGLYSANAQKADKPAGQQVPKPAAAPIAAKVGVTPAVPRASEYKGETEGQQLLNGVKSIASSVGTGYDAIRNYEAKSREENAIRMVQNRIKSNLTLTPEQKDFAIKNGLLQKD